MYPSKNENSMSESVHEEAMEGEERMSGQILEYLNKILSEF